MEEGKMTIGHEWPVLEVQLQQIVGLFVTQVVQRSHE